MPRLAIVSLGVVGALLSGSVSACSTSGAASCTPSPHVCPDAGCGQFDDGCGGTFACGGCPTGQQCNDTNACVQCLTACSNPASAANPRGICGTMSNRCGGTVSCPASCPIGPCETSMNETAGGACVCQPAPSTFDCDDAGRAALCSVAGSVVPGCKRGTGTGLPYYCCP
jgi:hypothetical protein